MVHNDKIWVMKVFTGSSRINALGFSWAYSGLVWVFLSDSLRSPIREGLRLGGRGLRAGSFERITEAERRQLKSKADFQCRFVWLSSQLFTKLIHPWVDGHSFGCDLTASQDWKLNTNSCVCVRERVGGGREETEIEREETERRQRTQKREVLFFFPKKVTLGNYYSGLHDDSYFSDLLRALDYIFKCHHFIQQVSSIG